MFSFINKSSNLFLIKTSYIYWPEDKIFVLILHLPLYISFSLAKFPITPDVGVNNMIAVEHSK